MLSPYRIWILLDPKNPKTTVALVPPSFDFFNVFLRGIDIGIIGMNIKNKFFIGSPCRLQDNRHWLGRSSGHKGAEQDKGQQNGEYSFFHRFYFKYFRPHNPWGRDCFYLRMTRRHHFFGFSGRLGSSAMYFPETFTRVDPPYSRMRGILGAYCRWTCP